MTHTIREAAEATTLKLVLHLENTDGLRVYDGSAGVTPSGATAIANALILAKAEGMREAAKGVVSLYDRNWIRARADEIEKEIENESTKDARSKEADAGGSGEISGGDQQPARGDRRSIKPKGEGSNGDNGAEKEKQQS